MDDYILWKVWWYAEMYGASPESRMAAMDRIRAETFFGVRMNGHASRSETAKTVKQ